MIFFIGSFFGFILKWFVQCACQLVKFTPRAILVDENRNIKFRLNRYEQKFNNDQPLFCARGVQEECEKEQCLFEFNKNVDVLQHLSTESDNRSS